MDKNLMVAKKRMIVVEIMFMYITVLILSIYHRKNKIVALVILYLLDKNGQCSYRQTGRYG